jgi:large subunit ribosomal protein L5
VSPDKKPGTRAAGNAAAKSTGARPAAKSAAAKPAAKSAGVRPAAKAAAAKPATAKPGAKPAAAKRSTGRGSATGASEAPAEQVKAARAHAPRAAGYQKPTYSGLRQRYRDEVVPALRREFSYANPMQVPRVAKVVVNIGLGEAIQNAKAIDAAVGDLATITGQKPIVTRATRSIAQFRLRTGMPIGAKVTLRGQRMYDFLERTLNLALPRIRDFRGIPTRSFDGRGNFSLGLREQLVYPEIDYDSIDRLRGLEISIVTTARTDEEGRKLLQLLGMPFQAN